MYRGVGQARSYPENVLSMQKAYAFRQSLHYARKLTAHSRASHAIPGGDEGFRTLLVPLLRTMGFNAMAAEKRLRRATPEALPSGHRDIPGW